MAAAESTGTKASSTKSQGMAAQGLKLVIAIAFAVPAALFAIVGHPFGVGKGSKHHNLRGNLFVSVLRALLASGKWAPGASMTNMQKVTGLGADIKGKRWIAPYTAPAPPEDSCRDVVMGAIERLMPDKKHARATTAAEIVSVEGEWQGVRPNVDDNEPEPKIPDSEKYQRLVEACTTKATTLYFHGGGYHFGDPGTHRKTTLKLAELSGGRVFSVRYRLAPQNAFPAALIDALVSYLTLLYPPPDALHEPISAQDIVISGDSAGGHLSACLVQLLLELRRSKTTVKWYGKQRDIPLPAGLALNSPWLDIGLHLVQLGDQQRIKHDYLRVPDAKKNWTYRIAHEAGVWPPVVPRENLIVEDHLLTHPLVSLITADWEGCPPVYVCTGWEILSVEDAFFAKKLHSIGVPIQFEDYEGMPHCFGMTLKGNGSDKCLASWSKFIRTAVENPGSISSSATCIKAKSLEEIPLQFDELSTISQKQAEAVIFTE
ncbi:hypothetical protein VHEMI09751 [[Torrubiella] hemipterigena]|uniref:Alpha/beta hydrolase fold-3 domain-containing protein n=1 Tax=[Torrubiella] hemipterigena TaxID=1531966 RepID=A0A0A1TH51_9HYPO|nr:hypothetical protein VHEMI09751 [[Torrubiella] hemipterigena]